MRQPSISQSGAAANGSGSGDIDTEPALPHALANAAATTRVIRIVMRSEGRFGMGSRLRDVDPLGRIILLVSRLGT
jgi:hypothetical protein